MSGAYLIATEKKAARPKPEFFGKAVARASRTLDKLAAQAGVTPLSKFLSASEEDWDELREIMEESGVDTSESPAAAEQWFTAAEGLTTVRALLGSLPQKMANADAVLEELNVLESVLAAIGKKKSNWHFWIDR